MSFVQLSYYSIDGVIKHENFHTVEEAREWAHKWIGEAPTLGRGYAVSDDGIAKIMARGCSLQELFPKGI